MISHSARQRSVLIVQSNTIDRDISPRDSARSLSWKNLTRKEKNSERKHLLPQRRKKLRKYPERTFEARERLNFEGTKMADAKDQAVATEQHIIPQLESLLHKRLGKDVILVEYTATGFLPPGENYGSFILKVDAKIRDSEDNEDTKDLHLIAKVPPKSQRQREFFDSPFTFKKETFMYDTILPTYKKFEEDCGVPDVFDIGPDFYGSRLSLLPGDVFDDDAVILMENLKSRGYYLGDRYRGLDYEHAILAVQAMAKFHALGMAVKAKKTDFFDVLKVRSKCLEIKNPDEWKDVMAEMYRTIEQDPVISEHYDKCLKVFEAGCGNDCWIAPPIEPWSTIIHADFWINNIMFHRNETTGKPDDIKFVDFQNYLFLSPLRELTFFLGSGVNNQIGVDETNSLIDSYYNVLTQRLTSMGCDISPYDRKCFDEQLLKDAYIEFTHSAFMLKIMTKEATLDDPDSQNLAAVMLDTCNQIFYDRLRDLVKCYVERGWL